MLKAVQRYYAAIAVVSVLAVAAISLLLLGSFRSVATMVKTQFAEQQAITGRQIALAIEENVALLVRELDLLSREPAIQRLDPVEARLEMEKTFSYAKNLSVNDVSRSDAAGIARIPLNSPELTGRDFSQRRYFKQLRRLQPGAPVFEFITFQGIHKGQKGLIIAMPVFRAEAAFAGSVLFVVEMGNLLERLLPPQSADLRSWVIDRDSVALFHPHFAPGTVIDAGPDKDPAFRTFLDAIKSEQPLHAEYVADDGKLVLATATPVKIAGQTWQVVTEMRQGAIATPLLRSNVAHFAGTLIAVLMIVASAFFIVFLGNRWNLHLQGEIAVRTRTEEELRRREESYRTLVENSPT